MSYVVFKRFAETDPSKAHAKLTHVRIQDLPIPLVDPQDRESKRLHDRIVVAAQALLAGADRLGGIADLQIEQDLRTLWGLSGDDGAYINGEFHGLPEGQVIRDLFPDGVPRPMSTSSVDGDEDRHPNQRARLGRALPAPAVDDPPPDALG